MAQQAHAVLGCLESKIRRCEDGARAEKGGLDAVACPIRRDLTAQSASTVDSLPSMSSSYDTIALEHGTKLKRTESSRRPSMLSRIKSSISTSSAPSVCRRQSVVPSDFQRPPEYPEKHFIDSVGMVIPGVCDRKQCSHPLCHLVLNWRLCAPIEYTTALADHGITYSDYCLLQDALANFLDDIPNDTNPTRRYTVESQDQIRRTRQQAHDLDALMVAITSNLRARDVPVMVCVGSYSLFVPHRISEAHIQILHVPLEQRSSLSHPTKQLSEQMRFVDPFSVSTETSEADRNVSTPHQKFSDPPTPPSPVAGATQHHHQAHLRDRSRPSPLWPNAIPTSKRALIDTHAGRYGVDPYFREYMRANVNSRANSASYAKFMIERENDPFVNTRLDYVDSPSTTTLLRDLLTKGPKRWNQVNSSAVNRDRYEHNRRLECRKTVELGSRLRLTRFGFRHPIYPPHTPEMTELGLTKEKYENVISHIDDIRQNETKRDCAPDWVFTRRRNAGDALAKVSEYLRSLNGRCTKVIWTIETIPGVYDGLLQSGKEWEISAWNSEDPLELLLQLEKWGILEKKLNVEDDNDDGV